MPFHKPEKRKVICLFFQVSLCALRLRKIMLQRGLLWSVGSHTDTHTDACSSGGMYVCECLCVCGVNIILCAWNEIRR